LRGAPFDNLDQLGERLHPKRSGKRVSPWLTAAQLPELPELEQLLRVCRARPEHAEQLLGRWKDATAETSARRAGREPGLAARVVVSESDSARLPVVADYRDPYRLGVHRPITQLTDGQDLTDRAAAGGLPDYVLREPDRLQLRPALVQAAAGHGPPVRLVVITGESASGKTRTALEAMRAELGGWRLLVPRSADQLAALLDAATDLRHVVVWLNEIQELLTQLRGVEQLDRLLDLTVGPTVLLATLRTDAEHSLHGTPAWSRLDQAHLRITLYRRPDPDEWEIELARARESADPWIIDVLAAAGPRYGIAEWLAAGPQLLRQWERARSSDNPAHLRTAAAIVDAAVQCYRAGYTTPIPQALLREAYPLYVRGPAPHCDDRTWEQALNWARASLAGAVGLLLPEPGGDRAFDYLLAADTAPVAERLWAILGYHVTPNTLPSISAAAHRLVPDSAHDREFYRRLIDLFTDRADHGDILVSSELAGLLVERGDLAALTRRADDGDGFARERLAGLLVERGDLAGLKRRADDGDEGARTRLVWLSVERQRGDDLATLTRHADDGDVVACSLLARLLAERGDLAGLARRADDGDDFARSRLAGPPVERGDLDTLTERDDEINGADYTRLVEVLVERGDLAGLTRRADDGDDFARFRLTGVLIERGDLAGLTRRADHGDEYARERLAGLLVERGDLDTLTRRADEGDEYARERLAGLLVERGDLDTLTNRADHGDHHAAGQLRLLRTARGLPELPRRAAGDDGAG
jgi:hypothetical protein